MIIAKSMTKFGPWSKCFNHIYIYIYLVVPKLGLGRRILFASFFNRLLHLSWIYIFLCLVVPFWGGKTKHHEITKGTNVKFSHHRGPTPSSEKWNFICTLHSKTIRMQLYSWRWQKINKRIQRHPMSKPKLMLMKVGWE
jgi:hypothetical protein